jgi:ribonuclease HI
VAWVEKRLRGARVWMLTDEQGRPLNSDDNRVDIVYRPGGKPYRAAIKNLEDAPGAADAAPLSEAELLTREPAARSDDKASSRAAGAPSLPGVSVAGAAPRLDGAHPIHVYTDGACTGNPGPMGIGVVILDPSLGAGGRRELSEYLGVGTNNIAELTAILRGLSPLPRDRPAIVYSDSAYAIGLLAQGWRAKANQELVAELRRLLAEFSRVYFIKVLGHSGVPENERCDELARAAIVRRRS